MLDPSDESSNELWFLVLSFLYFLVSAREDSESEELDEDESVEFLVF